MEAARQHMVDKSHCKVPFESAEDFAELSDFYSFDELGSSVDDSQWSDISDDDLGSELVSDAFLRG